LFFICCCVLFSLGFSHLHFIAVFMFKLFDGCIFSQQSENVQISLLSSAVIVTNIQNYEKASLQYKRLGR